MLRVLEATLLVVLLGAAILAWRLSQGPVALNAVAPYVASLLSDLDPDLQFRIERAEFRWEGFKGSPEITARDVRVLSNSGSVIAGLPTMTVRLESSALLKGNLAPKHVGLSNPIIRFVHRADGTFGLGMETAPSQQAAGGGAGAPTETSGNAIAVALLNALTRGGESGDLAFLETVSIEHTTLVLVDEKTGQRWLVPDAMLDFSRDQKGMRIQAALQIIEDGKPWQLTAMGAIAASSNTLNLDIDVDGLRPARLAALAPQLSPLAMIDLRLSGRVSTELTLANRGAQISSVKFDVMGQSGFLRLPDPIGKNYPIKKVELDGSAGKALDRITIDHFSMEADRKAGANPVLTMTADATELNTAPKIKIQAGLSELSIAALKDYWPETVKPNTHRWISRNLADGSLSNTELHMMLAGTSMADVDATDMLLTSDLHDMTVTYLSQMPKVRDARARMELTLHDLKIDVQNGHIPDAFSGKGVYVPNAVLRMTGLGTKGGEDADFDINIIGDFGDVMRVIDSDPLHYAEKMNIDPFRASGSADINLTLKFPLVNNLKLDQVEIGVKAKARDVGLAEIAFGLPLNEGNMSLALDNEGMDVEGSASLGGIKSRIVWRENFAGGEFRSRYVLDPIVSNDQRPLIGLRTIPFTPPYVNGDVSAHVLYTIYRDQTRHLDADIDLTRPAMSIPELGWAKEEGVPARARVTAEFTGDRLDAVPSFSIVSGDDLSVEGAAAFGDSFTLTSLTIAPSKAGETQISLNAARIDDGYEVAVQGAAFNATNFLKEINRDERPKEGAESADLTPFKIKASFDRMWFASSDEFKDSEFTFERNHTGIQGLDFTSTVNGEIPVTFALTSVDGVRTFKGESPDGGTVVRALGLFKDIVGGQLEVNGEIAPDGTMQGVASIENFQIVEAPLLARLLSVAALTGILDELRGGGISFKTLRLPFSYAKSKLSIDDGEMYGSSLGLTAKGTYDFPKSSMDLTGTLIPAYSVNAALNSIPVIGKLLTGGDKGSGIFAATYTYRGPIETAEPSVNPLAALTPGFLRHIFDIFRVSPPDEPSAASSIMDPPSGTDEQ